ncbi:MAG: type II secretion system protein [Acidobacteria bacterium]|nr:MAG: type II secretion system protein [Acidobacteriota bacterium]
MMRSIRKRVNLQPASAGFTLVELIAAMTIMLLLTTVALPVASMVVRRQKESELKEELRTMRSAIDRYKDFADSGMIPTQMDTYGYPPTLETLVKGVPLKGSKDKYKFLRNIPVDPMTGATDWGMRSMQDDPDSQSWGGQDVFDVFSKSQGIGMNGIPYAEW